MSRQVTKWMLFASLTSPLTYEGKLEVECFCNRLMQPVQGKVVKIEMEDGDGSSFNVTLQNSCERRVVHVRTVD